MFHSFILKIQYFILLFFVFFNFSAIAQEKNHEVQNWTLPLTIDDSNTKINFEVDSTWVLVKGSAKGINGSVFLEKNNAEIINTELVLPVSELKTGLSMRDRHMLEILASDKYPEIKVLLSASVKDCNPSILELKDHCDLIQKGQITIRGITREITLNSLFKKTPTGYEANGSIVFPWASFEIEDPSNLFAKLRDDVSIFYSVIIP